MKPGMHASCFLTVDLQESPVERLQQCQALYVTDNINIGLESRIILIKQHQKLKLTLETHRQLM